MRSAIYRQTLGGFCLRSRCGQGAQDDGLHQISQFEANFGQAEEALLREVVIFPQAAFIDPQAAVQQPGFLQVVQEGIEAAGTDLISESMEAFIQLVAIYRALAGLVENEDLHHPLEEIPVNQARIQHSRIMIYVC
jgi:hypothetical protein